jgi:predicted nucleic-acid-binding Zn-ribbon protein
MPVALPYKFTCKKCGYSKVYLIGDSITPLDFIKKCPKCGEVMERKRVKGKRNIFDILCRK